MGPLWLPRGEGTFFKSAGRGAQARGASISSPRRATAGVRLSIDLGLGPLFGLNAVEASRGGRERRDVRRAGRADGRHRRPTSSRTRGTRRARHARAERCAGGHASASGARGSRVTDNGGLGHQTGEPDGKPLSWLARDQGPPERHALRGSPGWATRSWWTGKRTSWCRYRARRAGRARGRSRGPGR